MIRIVKNLVWLGLEQSFGVLLFGTSKVRLRRLDLIPPQREVAERHRAGLIGNLLKLSGRRRSKVEISTNNKKLCLGVDDQDLNFHGVPGLGRGRQRWVKGKLRPPKTSFSC